MKGLVILFFSILFTSFFLCLSCFSCLVSTLPQGFGGFKAFATKVQIPSTEIQNVQFGGWCSLGTGPDCTFHVQSGPVPKLHQPPNCTKKGRCEHRPFPYHSLFSRYYNSVHTVVGKNHLTGIDGLLGDGNQVVEHLTQVTVNHCLCNGTLNLAIFHKEAVLGNA